MNKILYLFFCALSLVFFCVSKIDAQTINSHSEFVLCDSVDFHVDCSSGFLYLSLRISYGDGSSETFPIDSFTGSTDFLHAYDEPGVYTIKEVLYRSGLATDSTVFSDSIGFCGAITVLPYLDRNSNCIMDAGDINIFQPYDVEIDSAGVAVDTITATAIHYFVPNGVPYGTVYRLKVLNPPAGTSVSCGVGGIQYDTIGVSFLPRRFGFTCGSASGFDLSEIVHVDGPGDHRYDAHVIVGNSPCTPQNATLNMTFSPKYNLSFASPTPTSVVGNVIIWDFPAGTLLVPQYVNVRFDVPGPYLTFGDTIHSRYVLTPITGDSDSTNNTVTRIDTVRSSYDPNNKSVIPAGVITAGTNLNYSIAFENTGNGPAVNIHIQDTLSNNLDISSFKLESTTNMVYTTFTMDGAGHNVIKFDFPGINLLDSSHHGACDGMVTFTIDTKTWLPEGTIINNRAGIYFDANAVVMTNTATNVIGQLLNTNVMSNTSSICVYPNPSKDEITVSTDNTSYTKAIISNMLGQQVLEKQLTSLKTKVNISHLPAGLYYVTLKGESGVQVVKMEKVD